jgi:hypothetical protein
MTSIWEFVEKWGLTPFSPSHLVGFFPSLWAKKAVCPRFSTNSLALKRKKGGEA